MRPVAWLVPLLLPAVLACVPPAASPREGVRLDVAAPVAGEQLERVRSQVQARMDVLRPGTTVVVEGAALFVEMPLVEATPRFVAGLTAPGRMSIVPIPPGQDPLEEGASLDLPALIGPDGFAGGAVAVDQAGRPALDIELSPAAGEVFRAWTAANVGRTVAITIDGVVLSAPIINEAIAGGQVQISTRGPQPAPDHSAIAAVLASGPLDVFLRGAAETR